MNLAIVISAHLLADFWFQSNKVAYQKKCKDKVLKAKSLRKHCSIHLITLISIYVLGAIALYLETNTKINIEMYFLPVILTSALVVISHYLIDAYLKPFLDSMIEVYKKNSDNATKLRYPSTLLFLIDQSLHFAIIVIIYTISLKLNGSVFEVSRHMQTAVALTSTLVLLTSFTGIIISTIFADLYECKSESNDNEGVGRLIGYTERITILILIITQQMIGIGFLLTLKTFSRYKQLEDKSFTEKYILGTLLSIVIASIFSFLYLYSK